MNRLNHKRAAFKIIAAAAVCVLSASLASCHDAKASEGNTESSVADPRPDEALTKLMKALADDDARGFAGLCVYPIVRPYPLKDIQDSATMVDYFPVMIDAPMRQRMAKAKPADWESYGWRGWSIGDDTPIWFFDGVQSVDYMSPAEAGLQKYLSREELMTLAPRYRDGWTPVMSLIQIGGNKILRIDSRGDSYRLMAFDNPRDVSDTPGMLLLGNLSQEGSADTRIYEFADSTGTKAEYSPDGETPERLFIISPKGSDSYIEVRPAYWRDIIKY